MEYTKSKIRDSKKRIGYLMAKIIEWMPKVGDDMFAAGIVTEKLEDLCSELVPLKPYIIDNDLHALATEIDTLVAPIMDMNCNSLQHALTDNLVYKAQDIVKDLQDWISEYEEEHPVQPNRPVNNPTAKDFLTLFNALSRDCLMYIENKYDLGYKENPNVKTVLSPYMQHQIHEVIPNRITSGFNEGILTLANLNKVIEEIESNLDNCESLEVLERYVVKLLEPFRAVSDKMTMFQNENFEKQRAQIEEEMKKLGTPENCLIDLLFIMTKYANKLYAALIQRGFDLRRFQDEVEIYLKKEWTWFDIAPYVGGRKRAQHFMEHQKLPKKKHKSKAIKMEKPTRPTRFTTNITEGKARKIYSELRKQGYILASTEVGDWLWICGLSDKPTAQSNGDNNTEIKIDWLQGQNELAYFIKQLFRPTNGNDVWVIASRVFTIKGVEQSARNLSVACSKENVSNEKKDNIDKILE